MKKVSLFLCLFAVLLFSVSLFADSKVLTAAADPWAPFMDFDHPEGGLVMELVRAALGTQGYEVNVVNVPWTRAENGVRDGIYDILPNTWRTATREEYLMYSEPYVFNEVKFIKLVDDDFEFEGLESLTGKRVGTVRDYGYGTEFLSADNFERDEVANMMINIRKLVAGRLDLTLEDEIVARYMISNEAPELLERIAFTENSLSRNGLHLTVGLKNPRHEEIVSAFNKGLEIIKDSGVYAEILANYGVE